MRMLPSLRDILHQRRIGFQADEVMTGTHQFLDDAGPPGEHPLEYRVTWGTWDLKEWLNPFGPTFMTNFLEGKVTVGGLVESAPCQGTLELLYFSERKIRYTFEFKDGKGRSYRYIGEKVNILPWNLHRSHTTCYGTITDLESGRDISRSIVYFHLSTMLDFLRSFRLT